MCFLYKVGIHGVDNLVFIFAIKFSAVAKLGCLYVCVLIENLFFLCYTCLKKTDFVSDKLINQGNILAALSVHALKSLILCA